MLIFSYICKACKCRAVQPRGAGFALGAGQLHGLAHYPASTAPWQDSTVQHCQLSCFSPLTLSYSCCTWVWIRTRRWGIVLPRFSYASITSDTYCTAPDNRQSQDARQEWSCIEWGGARTKSVPCVWCDYAEKQYSQGVLEFCPGPRPNCNDQKPLSIARLPQIFRAHMRRYTSYLHV